MYIQRKNKKNYGFCLSISSRYVLARFSIGSRSSFVLPSFSLRCFFVRQSKINRRTNEETTKVKGKNFLGEDKVKRRWKRELSKMESLHQWATFCDNEGHIIFCFDILIYLSLMPSVAWSETHNMLPRKEAWRFLPKIWGSTEIYTSMGIPWRQRA